MKNPQTTIAPTFLTNIISAIDGVIKYCTSLAYTTPSIPELIWVKNVRAIVVCGFLMKFLKKHILKI